MALTAREREIMAGGAASAASEAGGGSFRAPGQSIRPYIQPKAPPMPNIVSNPLLFGATMPLLGLVEAAAPQIPVPALAIAGAAAYLTGSLLSNGSTEVVPGSQYGVPFGGPGLAEPGGKYLLKEWHIRQDSKDGDFDLQFYLTQNDRGTKRVFMYNQRTKTWKSWPMPRLAVIGKNMPRHQMITRLRRNLKRHAADAVTILKLVSPGKLESTRRPGGRYVRGRKRYID